MAEHQLSRHQPRPGAVGVPRRRRLLGMPHAAVLATVLASLLIGCSAEADSGLASPPLVPMESPAAVATDPPTQPGPTVASAGSPEPTTRPIPTPGPTVPRVPTLEPPAFASRVVVAGLSIDLPVISGDLQPPPSYPLCDVAAYVTRFNQPYENGITYISAHAQQGMFLPLLEASQRQDGQELLGQQVEVYVSDGRRFTYRIESVVRHAVDYAVVAGIPFDERYLILQTSEGPYGTVEKLQVVASFEEEAQVEPAEATPEPRPRDCRPAEIVGSPTP